MTSAKKRILQTPPKPWEMISQSVVAGLAGCSVDTVKRARISMSPPLGTLPWKPVGSRCKVAAEFVYEACGLNPDSPWMPDRDKAAKELREKLYKLIGAGAPPKSKNIFQGLFNLSTPSRAQKKAGGKIPLIAIQNILDELRRLGKPTSVTINGKTMKFGNFGDFLARAKADEEWLFMTPLNGRPLDIGTALYLGCWEGRLELLTTSQYFSRMGDALAYEESVQVADLLGGVTGNPPPNKGVKTPPF